MKTMHKIQKNKEEPTMKELVKKWLSMDTRSIPIPKTNQEKMIQGLITQAKKGDTKAFQTLNEIINDGNLNGRTPELQIHVVDNTRLEKFLYMTEEQLEKWKEEHKDQKEYKITCLSPEARMKLDEEIGNENQIDVK